MKIYFAASIRGGRDDAGLYAQLIESLKNYGMVLTEHLGLGKEKLSSYGEADLADKEIYNRDTILINEADVVVAEVSTPSLGVGYELGYAEGKGKKILCLYRPQVSKRLSAMVNGNGNLKVVEYTDLAQALTAIDNFLK
jgi:nucleoside 2-deoxyribosyltransferase